MSIGIIPVWKQVTPELQAELADFWLDHGALPDRATAEQRALQAVAIARDADGAIWGVSTATLRVLPRLRQPVYYYRQFFAPSHRGQRATRGFAVASRDVLEAFNATLPTPQAIGVLVEFENRELATRYTRGVEDGFAFIGYSPRGNVLRLAYFDVQLLPIATVAAPVQPAVARRA